MKFDRPTLVTLTAPTAAGKSYLLEHLIQQNIFKRVVSTTTRPPRAGEIRGVHYHFISRDESEQLEANNAFFELIEFNGTRYGITHEEMNYAMGDDISPIVVLEPQGVEIYEQKCREHSWGMFKIYVHVTESVRLQRLLDRTKKDVWEVMNALPIPTPGASAGRYDAAFANVAISAGGATISKLLDQHQSRLLSVVGDERHWQGTNRWDAIIPGDDVEKAIAMIKQGIKWRNSRLAEPRAMGSVELPL